MRSATWGLCLAVGLSFGCDDAVAGPDAGPSEDSAVAPMDAGPPPVDSGPTPADSGTDAFTPVDAHEPLDAGTDAGPPVDGGVDGGFDGGPPILLAFEYLNEYVEQICRLAVECDYKLGFFGALAQLVACHPDASYAFLGAVAEAEAAGTVTFDPIAGQACLDRFAAAASCADLFPGMGSTGPSFLCPEAWIGTRAPGATCSVDEECTDGHCALGAACPGTCIADVGATETCDRDAMCVGGLVCIDGACAALRDSGGIGLQNSAELPGRGVTGPWRSAAAQLAVRPRRPPCRARTAATQLARRVSRWG